MVSAKGQYKLPKYADGVVFYAHKEIKPEDMAHGVAMGTREVALIFHKPKDGTLSPGYVFGKIWDIDPAWGIGT